MGRRNRNTQSEEPQYDENGMLIEGSYSENEPPNEEPERETAIVELGDRNIIAKPMGEGIALSFDFETEPIFVGAETHKYGIGLPMRKVADLVDRGIVLYAARQFKSSLKGQNYAYYCICKDWNTGEMFATVFGSRSICELIESAALARFNRPIGFVIKWKQKGADDSYYYYESLVP